MKMGKTSNQSKQRWNADHYRQVKVSVKPDIVVAFKAACEDANVSMASEISVFMSQYIGDSESKSGYAPDLSSRRKRRIALGSIILQLGRIKNNEEVYRDRIPDSLQGSTAFSNADECISLIDEAIALLETAY
jgi:hypothetical protein